ncbi:MAG: ABC transporter ATP-binding protein, partial [Candidatus Paceibacteria bacterium]
MEDKNIFIKIENVSKSFWDEGHEEKVLSDISLKVYRGEFLAIVGPSGSGKSTLLRCLAGLMRSDKGRISIDGRVPEKCLGDNLAFVFQDFALFWWLTVTQNVEFGLKMKGVGKWERKKIANEKIFLMGLKGFENDYPDELSIGMRQRVGFARALAVDPELLLMDEPFSSLDAFTAEKLRQELLEIWKMENE